MTIPETYLPVMPYLVLNNSAAFLEFAKKVFGAKEQMIVPDENNAARGIMHGEIKIHDAVIMFAQSNEKWKQKTAGMFIYVENVDKVYKAGLDSGAITLREPSQQSYGYSAGFEDPFGDHWWLSQPE